MVGEWQQDPPNPNSPTPNPSPKGRGRLRTVSALPGWETPFSTQETPFSTLENDVFYARKRCFHCGEQVWPAATCHLAATTGMCLKHSGFGRLVAEWQQIF